MRPGRHVRRVQFKGLKQVKDAKDPDAEFALGLLSQASCSAGGGQLLSRLAGGLGVVGVGHLSLLFWAQTNKAMLPCC